MTPILALFNVADFNIRENIAKMVKKKTAKKIVQEIFRGGNSRKNCEIHHFYLFFTCEFFFYRNLVYGLWVRNQKNITYNVH